MSRELSEDAWNALLAALDPDDPDAAAQAYLDLQERLVRFFEWRNAAMPEELAFETLKRVALRFADGVELTTSVKSFTLGFARRVLQEHWRQPTETELDLQDIDRLKERDAEQDLQTKERLARCLDLCAELDPDAYELLLRFHQFEGRDRINQRRRLAEELGKTVNALRIEACRRRKELRSKLDRCLDGEDSLGLFGRIRETQTRNSTS